MLQQQLKLIERRRNNTRNLRTYRFEYIHRARAKNPSLRQIIVRATNPNGKTIQLAILTDDTGRSVESVVRLMFNRWVQENHFKYLDKHFGINQLTSYRSTPYEHLHEAITKRCTKSPERPAATAKETKEIASCKSATKRESAFTEARYPSRPYCSNCSAERRFGQDYKEDSIILKLF